MNSLDSADVLKDRRNLYFQGRWLGSAQGYSILDIKPGHVVPLFIHLIAAKAKVIRDHGIQSGGLNRMSL